MIAGLLALCLAVLLSAQDAARVSQKPPTVRVTTRLIEINAVVQDKRGRPVTDLTSDDFVGLDKGVEHVVPEKQGSVHGDQRSGSGQHRDAQRTRKGTESWITGC